MFRSPDIPTVEREEFDEEKYQEEKLWLERKQAGKILSSETDGGILLATGASFLLALVIGGTVGTMIAFFTRSFWGVIIPVVLVFTISFYFLRGNFSKLEIDPERGLILYEGNISLGGELRSTRYRGSYKIIESTLLVRFIRYKFFKSKPFIRLMTKSGYMRINFNPEEEHEFLEALAELGLLTIEQLQSALKQPIVREGPGYVVYYEKKFDRSEFYAELKRKRQAEKDQEKIQKRIKRQQLIEKSKKFDADTLEDEEPKP